MPANTKATSFYLTIITEMVGNKSDETKRTNWAIFLIKENEY